MLRDNLYRVIELAHNDGSVNAVVTLDPEHDIFKGHYPGLPVLPGACMIQIIKETLEAVLAQKLLLAHSPQLKFLQMVDPRRDNAVSLSMAYEQSDGDFWKVSGALSHAGAAVLRFQWNFRKF